MSPIRIVPFVSDHFPMAEEISKPTYYPSLWEPHEAFTARLSLYPRGCLSIFVNDVYGGYIFSHPWRGTYIPLGTIIEAIPPRRGSLYYIHDLCINPSMRGKGLGGMLFNSVRSVAYASGIYEMSLVSVLGSEGFWRRYGFEGVVIIEDYGPGVCGTVMSRAVHPGA